MAHEDEIDPIVPNPPFEVTLSGDVPMTLLVIPGWDDESQESRFEIYAGEKSIGIIRRYPYDIIGWEVLEGVLTLGDANDIGNQIDDHYFD
jgi:hypothetical protein